MIGRLTGEVVEKQPPHLLLEVRGVGYELEVPMSTFFRLPESGATVTLHTHLAVREDAHVLYGFYTLEERTLFRALVKVSGVGAKMALGVLSGMAVEEFVAAIHHQDTAALVRLPGVGKKTAERLVVEMRDRLKEWGTPVPAAAAGDLPGAAGAVLPPADAVGDAVAALEALGYRPQEALKMVKRLGDAVGGLPSEEIIRRALSGVAG